MPNCFVNIIKSNKSIYFPLSQRFKIRNFSPIYPSIWQSDTEANCLPVNIPRRVSVQGALWNTTPDSPHPRIPVGTPERASIPRPVDYRLSLTSTGAASIARFFNIVLTVQNLHQSYNCKKWNGGQFPKSVSLFILQDSIHGVSLNSRGVYSLWRLYTSQLLLYRFWIIRL